jgi:hypothetical protein
LGDAFSSAGVRVFDAGSTESTVNRSIIYLRMIQSRSSLNYSLSHSKQFGTAVIDKELLKQEKCSYEFDLNGKILVRKCLTEREIVKIKCASHAKFKV